MCSNKNCGFTACGCVGLIISIVFGALIAVLYSFGLIPNLIIAAWIAFGLAVLTLIFLVSGVFLAAVSSSRALRKCLYRNATCLLAGIIGTIIATIAVLLIDIIPATIAVLIVVSIAAFFFALMIIGLIALIQCIVCEIRSDRNGVE